MQYPYEKQPAFFRIMSPELFFEADAQDSTLSDLGALSSLDAELDAILSEVGA